MIRFVICVDIEEDDTTKAYGEMYEAMRKSGLDWESTDEWFPPEEGEPGDPDELQAARMAYFGPEGPPPYDAATATGMYDRDDG